MNESDAIKNKHISNQLLHQQIKNFSNKHLKLAQQLNLNDIRNQDPHVERLLEGVSQICTHIQHQIDNSYKNLSMQLAENLIPHFLKPYPSTCILQLCYHNKTKKAYHIPKGTKVKNKISAITSQFSSGYDLHALPITITGNHIYTANDGKQHLQLQMQYLGHDALSAPLPKISLYLNTYQELALELLQFCLATSTQTIVVDSQQIRHKTTLTSPYLALDKNLLPNNNRYPSGYSLLLDYFHCQEKFFFIQIPLPQMSINPGDTFYVEIISDHKISRTIEINKEIFALNTVPAINLYETQHEGQWLDTRRDEQHLNLNSFQSHQHLYQINQLFVNEKPLASSISSISVLATNIQTPTRKLTIDTTQHGSNDLLHSNILVYNDQFPHHYLKAFELESTIEPGILLQNITRPSPCHYPYLEENVIATMIGDLTINLQNLLDTEQLKKTLVRYDWRNNFNQEIAAITQIQHRTQMQMHNGIAYRCLEIDITIDDHKLSPAAIFLWHRILALFIKSYISPNFLIKLNLQSISTKQIFTTPATPGEQHYL